MYGMNSIRHKFADEDSATPPDPHLAVRYLGTTFLLIGEFLQTYWPVSSRLEYHAIHGKGLDKQSQMGDVIHHIYRIVSTTL